MNRLHGVVRVLLATRVSLLRFGTQFVLLFEDSSGQRVQEFFVIAKECMLEDHRCIL